MVPLAQSGGSLPPSARRLAVASARAVASRHPRLAQPPRPPAPALGAGGKPARVRHSTVSPERYCGQVASRISSMFLNSVGCDSACSAM